MSATKPPRPPKPPKQEMAWAVYNRRSMIIEIHKTRKAAELYALPEDGDYVRRVIVTPIETGRRAKP